MPNAPDQKHGRLFDNFSAQASHTHGGSYFDAGFGVQTLEDAHGRLYDLFGARRGDELHGDHFDEFGWKAMPAIHGQLFDSSFRTEIPQSDGHHGRGDWYDVFRGGTQVRYMLEGLDCEGTVISVNDEYATVESSEGQTHQVGLSQFLEYRTPTQEQASPPITETESENPSRHDPTADGAHVGDERRHAVDPGSKVDHVSPGPGNTDTRSGLPAGLMSTFDRLKTLAVEMDVEKVSDGVVTEEKIPQACKNCGTKLNAKRERMIVAGALKSVHVATCPTCQTTHVGSDGAGAVTAKSVDTTELAVQGKPTGKTVGHRNNCPKGGSAPCGAETDGRCGLCKAEVHDHDAVGKAFGSPADALAGGQTRTVGAGNGNSDRPPASSEPSGPEVPQRDHKSTDHHSSQEKPDRCPHCGAALARVTHATEQARGNRQEKQGHKATFDTVSHKCVGTGLDLLKSLTEAS